MDADVIISAVGLTVIITQSYIFKGIRKLFTNKHMAKLIKCSMCVGFWCGGIIYSLTYNISLEAFKYACISSVSSYTWWLLLKPCVDKYD